MLQHQRHIRASSAPWSSRATDGCLWITAPGRVLALRGSGSMRFARPGATPVNADEEGGAQRMDKTRVMTGPMVDYLYRIAGLAARAEAGDVTWG